MTSNGNAVALTIASVGIAIMGATGTASASTETTVVDGVEYAVCIEEDCSDQPGQIGVWTSKRTGLSYLIIGEDQTYPISK